MKILNIICSLLILSLLCSSCQTMRNQNNGKQYSKHYRGELIDDTQLDAITKENSLRLVKIATYSLNKGQRRDVFVDKERIVNYVGGDIIDAWTIELIIDSDGTIDNMGSKSYRFNLKVKTYEILGEAENYYSSRGFFCNIYGPSDDHIKTIIPMSEQEGIYNCIIKLKEQK